MRSHGRHAWRQIKGGASHEVETLHDSQAARGAACDLPLMKERRGQEPLITNARDTSVERDHEIQRHNDTRRQRDTTIQQRECDGYASTSMWKHWKHEHVEARRMKEWRDERNEIQRHNNTMKHVSVMGMEARAWKHWKCTKAP